MRGEIESYLILAMLITAVVVFMLFAYSIVVLVSAIFGVELPFMWVFVFLLGLRIFMLPISSGSE